MSDEARSGARRALAVGGACGLRAVGGEANDKMKLKRQGDAREFEVELLAQNKQDDADAGGPRAVRITIDGREVAATVAPMPDGSAMVELDGRRVRVAGARMRSSIVVAAGPCAAEFVMVEGRAAHRAGGLAAPEVDAPMPGKVLKVLVAEGQPVEQAIL